MYFGTQLLKLSKPKNLDSLCELSLDKSSIELPLKTPNSKTEIGLSLYSSNNAAQSSSLLLNFLHYYYTIHIVDVNKIL